MEFKEECDVCGKETVLSDAIYENRPVKVCNLCKIIPEMILIEKPTQEQVDKIYRRYTFSSRAKQELQNRNSSSPTTFRGFTIDDLRRIKREKEEQEQKTEEDRIKAEATENQKDEF